MFLAVVLRLFYWQIISTDQLNALAEKQHLATFTIEAPRGIIFSSDMSVLATNKPSFLLYGLPKIIAEKYKVAEKLADVLSKSKPEFVEMRNQLVDKLSTELYWVPLKKGIDLKTKEEIEKLKIEGIGFESYQARFYPEASTAAHLLGFVGQDSLGRDKGYFGIEGVYDRELRGVSGQLIEEKDARGLPILIGYFFKREPQSGRNLVLSVDRAIQYMVEKKLAEGVKKYGAKSGSVVVMDPKTGEILAVAAHPNYDPNIYWQFPKENFKNPLVADGYEPGSTFKVLVMAAALDEGSVEPDTKCDSCDGPVGIGGFLIRTWNNKYYPDSTVRDIVIHSDNTGMVFVARKLGLEKLVEYLQSFGLGQSTGIDLQDETTPSFRPKEQWKEVDVATASFGQGISITAIQMVRAVAAIANGGYLLEPHIVKAIQDNDRYIEIKPKILRRVIKEETAQDLTSMMVMAVEKGEARVFKPKGFKIAGKTGTAQIPIAGHYDPQKTITSFVGFAPVDDPKFVMLVRYDQPSSSIFGSETAAPTFFEIAKELFVYFNIPQTPD